MDDLLSPAPDSAEVAELRTELNQLASVVRLILGGLLVLTLSLGLYIYRQDVLLHRQFKSQVAVIMEAEKKNQEILAIVAEFQKFGATHPDYASNVLSKFNLPALSAAPVKAPAAPVKK